MPGDVTVRLKATEEMGSVLFVCGVKRGVCGVKGVGGGGIQCQNGVGDGGRLVVQYVPVRDREVGSRF